MIKNIMNPQLGLGFKKILKYLIIFVLIIFIGIPILTSVSPFYTVDYGTMGVVIRFGKIDRLAYPGLNLRIPLVEKIAYYTTQKIIYETSEQPEESPYYNQGKTSTNFSAVEQKSYSDSADYPVDTSTMDGQQVSIRYTLRYRLDPDKIMWIAENIGTQDQVALRIVQAESRSVVRNVAREFPATNLYTGDIFTYQSRVAEKLNESFSKNGIILDEFLVRQIKFADQYIAAVEQKQIEQERVKTEEFKAQQEEFIKQQKIIRSEGEAKSQELLSQTITDLVLQKMAIEKWDGILPTYMGGNGEVPFINVK